MNFGIIGSGSWGTALAKILTDNGHSIYWWNRNESTIRQIQTRHHNPHYLNTAYFDVSKLTLTTNVKEVIENSDCILVAVPSAYIKNILNELNKNIFSGKKIIN